MFHFIKVYEFYDPVSGEAARLGNKTASSPECVEVYNIFIILWTRKSLFKVFGSQNYLQCSFCSLFHPSHIVPICSAAGGVAGTDVWLYCYTCERPCSHSLTLTVQRWDWTLIPTWSWFWICTKRLIISTFVLWMNVLILLNWAELICWIIMIKKKKKSFKVISSFVPGHNLITESVFYDVTPSLCYLSSRLPPSQWPGRRSLCPGGVCPHTTLNNVTPLRAYHAYPNRDLSLIAADLGHRSVSDWSHLSPLPLFPIRGLNRNTEEKRNTFVCRRYSGTFSSWLSF